MYKVTAVEISADSTISIHLKDPESALTDNYFDVHYRLFQGGYIQEIEIFKGKKFLYGKGFHTSHKYDRFKEANMIGGQCYTMNEAIKKSMSDPGSFDHVKTEVTYIQNDVF